MQPKSSIPYINVVVQLAFHNDLKSMSTKSDISQSDSPIFFFLALRGSIVSVIVLIIKFVIFYQCFL